MKIIKPLKYNMNVYIVGHVSYGRKDDIKLHDDDIKIKIMCGDDLIGSLRTDGNVQLLNTQQYKKFLSEVYSEKGYYPDYVDVIKIFNPNPSNVLLGLQSGKTLLRSGMTLEKCLSKQDCIKDDLKDLFISYDRSAVSYGIVPIEDLLEEKVHEF